MDVFSTAGDSLEYLRVYRDPRFTLDRYREVLVEDSFLHRPVVVVGRTTGRGLFVNLPAQTLGTEARGGNVFFLARV